MKLAVLVAGLSAGGSAWAACSASHSGRATLNELNNQAGFVEVKLLDSTLDPSVYGAWTLTVCSGSGGSACASVALSSATVSLPYLVFTQAPIVNRINLDNSGMAARLDDAAGNTVDYFRIRTYDGLANGGCTPSFPWLLAGADHQSNTKSAYRDPDGTGAWTSQPGNSAGETVGGSNGGSAAPLLSSSVIPVTRGQPALFTLTLPAAAGSPVTITYRTENGTAVAGADYTAASGSVTIPAGGQSATVSVPTLATSAADGEQFYLVLTGVTNAKVTDHYIAATINAPPIPAPLANWRMEESAGVAAVADSSGNGYSGVRSGDSSTADTGPAIAGDPGSCRYATFDGLDWITGDDAVEPAGFPHLNSEFTFTTWLYSTAADPKQTIVDDHDYNFLFSPGEGYALLLDDFSGGAGRVLVQFSGTSFSSNRVIQVNRWYFVALSIKPLTAASTRVVIRVIDSAGTVVATNSQTIARPMTVATGQTLIGNSSFGLYPFAGRLDESTYFQSELSLRQLQEVRQRTHPCTTAAIHHFELAHDADGLTCAPEAVTVRACLDAACTSTYAGSVDVTLTPSGWVGGNTRTISGGSADLQLRWLNAGEVTIGLSASTVAANQPLACRIGGSLSDCKIMFRDSGFVFDVPNHAACGTSGTVTISAVRKDELTQSCGPAFSGAKSVGFSYSYDAPVAGIKPLALAAGAGTVSLATDGSVTPVSLNFDAAGQTTVAVSYADAGRLRLNATHMDTVDGKTLLMDGDDLFVVRPHSFFVRATTDGSTPLSNPGATGNPHWPAQSSFQMQLRGQCADGTLTPNYAPTNAELWVEPVSPTQADGGAAGVLTLRGIQYAGAFSPVWSTLPAAGFAGGAVIESDQAVADPDSYAEAAYSEVGIVAVHVRDGDYMGMSIPEASLVVGRFRPDRFNVSVTHGQLRDACSVGTTPFTYTGSPFTYVPAGEPTLTITPLSASGAALQNYQGAFQKLTAAGIVIDDPLGTGVYSDFTQDNASNTGKLTFSRVPAMGSLSNSGGVMTYTFGADSFVYDKSAESRVAAFSSDIRLDLIAVQEPAGADGVGAAGLPQTLQPAAVNLRFGRLIVDNAYGSELVARTVPIRSEYFDGNGYVPNTDDSCTSFDAGADIDLAGGSYVAPLAASDLEAAGAGVLVNGRSSFVLRSAGGGAAGPGKTGSVSYLMNVEPYLGSDWDNDGDYDDDPRARASFGIYRGSDKVIYTREVH